MASPGFFGLVPSPAKKSKLIDFMSTCLICQIRDTKDQLSFATAQGKTKLFECMKARAADEELFSLCQASNVVDDTGIITDVCYHRKCYQIYTCKYNVPHRKEPKPDDSSQPGPSCESSYSHERTTRQSVQPFASDKCIFCNCAKKHGDCKLIQIRSKDVQKRIQDAAEIANDPELLIKVQEQDLFASDAKYHKNCLGNFLNKTDRQGQEPKTDDDSDLFTSSFKKLISDVDVRFKQGKAYKMTELLDYYRGYLTESGYADSKNYRCEKLKKRLQKYYGDLLTFHPLGSNNSELVYSSTLDIRETINKIADFQAKVSNEAIAADLKLVEDSYESLSVCHTASVLRSSAKQTQGISVNPCVDSKDICNERATSLVPDNLYDFLSQVMTGKTGNETKNVSEEHRRVLAVAQDVIYTATGSRCKSSKHVGIAMAVHHLTKSRQLLDMLHRQGHSLSYDEVLRIETATASTVMSSIAQDNAFIPSNISCGIFSHAAMDNIDIMKTRGQAQALLTFWGVCYIKTKLGTKVVHLDQSKSRLMSDPELLKKPNALISSLAQTNL